MILMRPNKKVRRERERERERVRMSKLMPVRVRVRERDRPCCDVTALSILSLTKWEAADKFSH